MKRASSHRPLATAALVLAMCLAAVEATIVATAMPSIVAALGGFAAYSWVFSAYLLAEAVSIPLYGKLADLFGRKPVFLLGMALFLAGTVLCGLARSMSQLIAFRCVQGLGAGAVMPVAATIVGDLYSPEERPKVQGALNSVWAVASVAGPVLGGFILEHLAWPWIFFVNVPFGLASAALLMLFFREAVTKTRVRVDYAGAAALTPAIAALMVVLVQGGTAWPWRSWPTLLLAAVCAGCTALFVRVERRAPEPLLPLDVLQDRTILLSNAGGLLGGGLAYALSSFVPTFAQGVLGVPATAAGLLVTVVSLGWPLASVLTGPAWRAWGQPRTAVLGSLFLVASGALLASAGAGTSPWQLGAASFAMGMGLGFTQTTYLVIVQSRVGWDRRGVVTSSHMFARILGSTVWVALLGGVLNQRLQQRLLGVSASTFAGGDVGPAGLDIVALLLDFERREQLGPEVFQQLQAALASGVHAVFVVMWLTAAAALAVACLLPREAGQAFGASASRSRPEAAPPRRPPAAGG